MVRKIFKGRVIAAAGPLPGQLTVDNLKSWTQLRGGKFSDTLDETVTHLLCTEEQFRRSKTYPHVRRALKERKKLHVLHFDWYEFSCTDNKRLPEREFSMRNVLAKEKAQEREKDRAERGRRDGERFVNTNFFHVYYDREMFPYQVTITRDEEDSDTERYEMTLWESHAKPNLYHFTVKYLKKKGSPQPSYYRPSPCAGKWRPEMDLFMDFFQIKTGIAWVDRVMLQQTMGPQYFQYKPPTDGKPVGRRLRLPYEECLKINAQERGLPWPPVEEDPKPAEAQNDEEMLDAEDDDEGIGIDDTGADDDHGEQLAQPRAISSTKSSPEVQDGEDVDSGVSVNQSDDESDEEPEEASPKTLVSADDDRSEQDEWKQTAKFINNMNERLAIARDRILLAQDAILDARDALPGYLQGYLKYY